MQLVIGNKNYSSWSLRAWLMLATFDIPFEEIQVALSVETTSAEIARYSAAGRVPVLIDGDLTVWDSLAICEYVSEQYLHGRGWPENPYSRAIARSACAEMHSGFFALRDQMPMNCRANDRRVPMTEALQQDLTRLDRLWSDLRQHHSAQGPWLLGKFSIADCMFAPVAFRFMTYRPFLSEVAQDYVATSLAHPQMRHWVNMACKEIAVIEADEAGEDVV